MGHSRSDPIQSKSVLLLYSISFRKTDEESLATAIPVAEVRKKVNTPPVDKANWGQ